MGIVYHMGGEKGRGAQVVRPPVSGRDGLACGKPLV